jgi:DNA-directed RNA polymerase subunit RPC12/RpoP
MAQSGTRVAVARRKYWGLKCPRCGNKDRFLETMAYETHFVDGRLNYLHLDLALTDHYECLECGRRVDPGWHWQSVGRKGAR